VSILTGLCELPWWGYILAILGLTHITIAAVTLFLHRYQAHHAIEMHPVLSHFFRFWLWLTTGMNTREWVAVHRKHHARVETKDDPHSPQIVGIRKVLLEGTELYKLEAGRQETLVAFGHDTPDDWVEQHVYSRLHYTGGIISMLLIDFVLFGFIGITIWAIQMAWIPFFAAGVINGVGHWGGYRNFETSDASTNIIPWGILIGGEELHNNHHAFASSAKFSSKWWEIDLGWCYLVCMQKLKLARIKKIAPRLQVNQHKLEVDLDTLRAVITNRFHVMSRYTKNVVTRVYKEEKNHLDITTRKLLRRGRRLITLPDVRLDESSRQDLDELLQHSDVMQVVYEFGQRLQVLWTEKSATHDHLLQALREWCEQAERTGITALEEFARSLRTYTLNTA
jgi:stearoyl-CoA desaturase (Delta-9 desaturase)